MKEKENKELTKTTSRIFVQYILIYYDRWYYVHNQYD